MAKQSKHIENCIRVCEMSAKMYREKEAEYRRMYEMAGPGSFYFDLMINERAVAMAYENCAEMLKDPQYFDRKSP